MSPHEQPILSRLTDQFGRANLRLVAFTRT